jgi:hypothetical protein
MIKNSCRRYTNTFEPCAVRVKQIIKVEQEYVEKQELKTEHLIKRR